MMKLFYRMCLSRVRYQLCRETDNILFLCFVVRASRYNRAKKTNLMRNLFLVYFVNLYMFRAYLGPSSSNEILSVQELGLIIL